MSVTPNSLTRPHTPSHTLSHHTPTRPLTGHVCGLRLQRQPGGEEVVEVEGEGSSHNWVELNAFGMCSAFMFSVHVQRLCSSLVTCW